MWSEYWPMPAMFFGPAIMILFVIVCIVVMSSVMRGGMHQRDRRSEPLDILKERFARGEINQAEYEERRRLLQA
jgi:putative membrane protein